MLNLPALPLSTRETGEGNYIPNYQRDSPEVAMVSVYAADV